MSEFKENKSKGIFVTLFIGFIILTFVFTGYQSFQNGPMGADNVGSVGSLPIKPREFEMEYNRQIEFYKQITGGADLTSKQIENFKIKDSIIKNIVQRKMMVIFAEQMGVAPSETELKNEIKKLPYFLTNEQFDINKYKNLLAANGYSPMDFEKDIANDLRLKSTQGLMENVPVSSNYINDLNAFRKNQFQVTMVTLNKENLRKHLPVTESEIQSFLSNDTNRKKAESLFQDRKASFDKPEEVKARHILVNSKGSDAENLKAIQDLKKMVTPQNFSKIANEKTDDPSGKSNGGDLGFFSRGRMVPEFDEVAFKLTPGTISEPVKSQFGYHLIYVESKKSAVTATFDDHKVALVKELIQRDRTEDLKKLTLSLSQELRTALEKQDTPAIKSITSKYSINFDNNVTLNPIDGFSNGTQLNADQQKEVLAKDNTVHLFDDASNVTILRTVKSPTASDAVTAKVEEEKAQLKNALRNKFSDQLFKAMEKDVKVRINHSALRI